MLLLFLDYPNIFFSFYPSIKLYNLIAFFAILFDINFLIIYNNIGEPNEEIKAVLQIQILLLLAQ